MRAARLYHNFRLLLCRSSVKRAEYLKKHNILGAIGNNCKWGPWIMPLYPKLIRLHDNVTVHKHARFLTHDMLNKHLKRTYPSQDFGYGERIGCIELMDNVYIATRVLIMHDVKINKNSIITAMSVVTSDIPENSIASGNPAKPVGRFDMFAALRKMGSAQTVPFSNQDLPEDVAAAVWEKFDKRHSEH